jgi:hypothetical protein
MDAMEGQKEMAEVEEELAERGVGDTKRRDLEGGALPPSPSKLVAGPAETIFASVTALGTFHYDRLQLFVYNRLNS